MPSDRCERLIAAAKKHGENSNPDHEVGDLQDILRSCFEVMTPEQRKQVFETHSELVAQEG
jgi:hypothetical protein